MNERVCSEASSWLFCLTLLMGVTGTFGGCGSETRDDDSSAGGTTGGVAGTGGTDGSSRDPQAPAGPPPVVSLFEGCGYGGAQARFAVGDYDSAALLARDLAPAAISAVRVTPGFKAILYDHDGFLGQSVTLTADDECLTDLEGVASLRIRENLGGDVAAGGAGSTTCDETTPQTETCEPFGVLLAGTYWINNNLWGQQAGMGEQCVRRRCLAGGAVDWDTSWSWSNAPSSVKSFASAVLGWHWGYHVQDTGLPIRLSEARDVDCSWSYTVQQNGTMNVAYDLWLHSVPDPSWGDSPTDRPTDELMIWLYRAGGAGPLGAVQGPPVSLGGASWNLHRGQIVDEGEVLWNVYSFVRTENTSSATLNLREFIDEVVGRGWMPSSRYLTSVQAGPEVFVGSGELHTSSFRCDVR